MVFRFAAVLVSLMVAGAPVAADYCSATCETAHVHGVVARSLDANHHHDHHSVSSILLIHSVPQPCGHDHTRIIGIAANGQSPVKAFATALSGVAPAPVTPANWATVTFLSNSNAPPGAARLALSSPIRI